MTRRPSFSGLSFSGASALAAAILMVASATPSLAEGPFSAYQGNWSGIGVVSVSNGSKEKLRCRAHYDVGSGGSTLSQNLTCASDSYKFNVVADVRSEGGAISGNWEETSRSAKGRISGSITPSQVSAYVQGVGFTARIGIAARAGKQSITISPTGTDISNVSVTLSKS